jgi:hypothetical protein
MSDFNDIFKLAVELQKKIELTSQKDWEYSSDILNTLDIYCYESRRLANELEELEKTLESKWMLIT